MGVELKEKEDNCLWKNRSILIVMCITLKLMFTLFNSQMYVYTLQIGISI